MRIGFLGPSGGDLDALERAATFLLWTENVARAVYLGNDGALDRCVVAWAKRLVGDDPSDEGAWERAGDLAATGSPEEIDHFVSGERQRLRLRALATLPEDAPYVLEMADDVCTLMTFDAASLVEEDVARADLVVIGRGSMPRFEERGPQWVLELGSIGPRGGIAVLDAQGTGGVVTVYDSSERELLRGELYASELDVVSEPEGGS
jgi:hypothetical protein